MTRNKLLLAVLVVALTLVASPAKAEFINFLDSFWQPGGGDQTITKYVAALDANITITASGGANELYWDSTDGFGVKGGEQDEVDRLEKLTITFDKNLYLSSFNLTDLFTERGYFETGFYKLNGGSAIQFMSDPSQVPGSTNGLKLVSLNSGPVTSLEFYALNPVPEGQHHDFSVAGLRASATPEPGTLLLFGSALTIGLIRRRRRKG